MFSLFQCIGVAGVCIIRYACHSPAQRHGIVLLLLSTWYNIAACVVVLLPQILYLPRIKESAWTLGVLDVDE